MSVYGKWIVVTGRDAAAAQALRDRLYEWMRQQGWPVEQAVEPTFGPAGVLLRQHRAGRVEFDPFCLALLETADRLDHWSGAEGLQSRLAAGRYVLCLCEPSSDDAGEVSADWRQRIQARCRPDLILWADENGDGLTEEAWSVCQASLRQLIEGDDAG